MAHVSRRLAALWLGRLLVARGVVTPKWLANRLRSELDDNTFHRTDGGRKGAGSEHRVDELPGDRSFPEYGIAIARSEA